MYFTLTNEYLYYIYILTLCYTAKRKCAHTYFDGELLVVNEEIEDVLETVLQVGLVSELDLTEVSHHPTCLGGGGGGKVNGTCTYVNPQYVESDILHQFCT